MTETGILTGTDGRVRGGGQQQSPLPAPPALELADQPDDDAFERERKAALRQEAKEIKAEVERRLGSASPPAAAAASRNGGSGPPSQEPSVPVSIVLM